MQGQEIYSLGKSIMPKTSCLLDDIGEARVVSSLETEYRFSCSLVGEHPVM